MFCDETTIKIQAGNGGNGCVSFHREKYVPNGPPDGGDGGRGGHVIFKVNSNLNTLSNFRRLKFFHAKNGGHGEKCNRNGKNGEDLILEVPEGTLIFDESNGDLLADFIHKNEKLVAAKGGKGGLGNAHFVSSVKQAPEIAEKGEPGKKYTLKLELKLVAEVGIIGLPNAGKSTLISVISNARPKIASYPFTTLVPNLGVVRIGDKHVVICDVPGLISGAYKGKGLGDKFLKHIERTRVLIHLIDITEKDPVKNYQIINNELKLYSKKLQTKKQIIVFNKIDSINLNMMELILNKFKKKHKKIKKVYSISAVSKSGIKEMLFKVLAKLEEVKKKDIIEDTTSEEEIKVFRPHETTRMSNFEIKKKRKKVWVEGKRIEQLIIMTDFSQSDSERRVYNIFKKIGLMKELKKTGLQDGDIFLIGEKKLKYKEDF